MVSLPFLALGHTCWVCRCRSVPRSPPLCREVEVISLSLRRSLRLLSWEYEDILFDTSRDFSLFTRISFECKPPLLILSPREERLEGSLLFSRRFLEGDSRRGSRRLEILDFIFAEYEFSEAEASMSPMSPRSSSLTCAETFLGLEKFDTRLDF